MKTLAAYLRAAFRYAERMNLIVKAPYVTSLEVDNVRRGFFEPADFERLYRQLPDPINDVARFGYLVGWRKEEILGLTWSMVDRAHQVILLPDSKNGEGRPVPLSVATAEGRVVLELGQLIEKRWKARALGCQYVFHRGGQRVRWINQQWDRACRACDKDAEPGAVRLEGRVPHDLRRTAYRNLIEAGVDSFTAMDICGHKTQAMARRYAIKNTRTMARALLQRDRFHADSSRTVAEVAEA